MTEPAITLQSTKSIAAAQAADELDSGKRKLASLEEAAVAGRLTGRELAAYQDDVDLAQLRATLTAAAAAEERANLASDNQIHSAVQELLNDPALDTDELEEGFSQLGEALTNLQETNDRRNNAIRTWVQRLRDLGIPDRGLTIGDDELTIYSSAIGGTQISLGSNAVEALSKLSPLISHATHPHIRDAGTQKFDPAVSIPRLSKRADQGTNLISVRLSRPLGGHPAGHILTSRDTSRNNLARMVRDGQAEHLDGELPSIPEALHRTYMPAGSDPTPTAGEPNVPSPTETRTVEAAVDRAFA